MSEITGVLPRAHAVLTALSAAGRAGVRLKDVTDATGLSQPTVHRLLRDLSAIGFVEQRPDRRYGLGTALYWLGLAAPSPISDLPTVRALAQSLANSVGDTVYVSVREPDGVRYVIRAEGDYPIRSHVVAVGESKPFTTSYSGLAMLATLPVAVQESALEHIVLDAPGEWANQEPDEEALRDAIEQVRARGWCTGSGLVMPGVAGIATPIVDQTGRAIAALSISAVEMRLPAARAETVAPQLLETARRISEAIRR